MKKIKHILLILLVILLSFLICAPTTPPEKSEENFNIYMDIPSEHRIRIINYGHGSIFFNNTKKYSEDVITCKRFSDVTFTIVPDNNYEIDKLNFNNNDITSNLNLNTITLDNVVEDGTLIVKFKAKPSPITLPSNTAFSSDYNSYIDIISSIKDFSYTAYGDLEKAATDFSDSVKTGDYNMYIILSIFVLSAFYITYRAYKALKK